MELLFSLFLLAGILGVPLFCLVSGGIALSRGRGGWGRIVVGALWLGFVGLGCLAVGGGGPPGFLVALAVIFVALLSVVPLGLLVSGIVAAANRRGGRGRIAVAAVWFAAAAALVLLPGFRDERLLGSGLAPDGREWCLVQVDGMDPRADASSPAGPPFPIAFIFLAGPGRPRSGVLRRPSASACGPLPCTPRAASAA